MDWIKMLDAAKAENAHGIEVRRGKKYTTAAIRVEVLRRHLGGEVGIATEIVHWGVEQGTPIVVKATVTDATGRILATGHAEEIRGKGQVNATSALENAETSAIGRALASLGLSGGEFASANEMEGVERKREAQANAPAAARPLSQQAAALGPRQEPVPKPPISKLNPKVVAREMMDAIKGAQTAEELKAVLSDPAFRADLAMVRADNPDVAHELDEAADLKAGEFAPVRVPMPGRLAEAVGEEGYDLRGVM